jgi:putative DNA primase/helicase
MHVRQLHKNEIEAIVTFTLWLIANDGDLPRIRPEDEAMWERVRRIPIGGTIPADKRDPALRESMGSEAAKSAALAWMVAGAVQWYADGLGAPPECVTEAGKDLRSEMDELAPFVTARIVFHPEAKASKKAVREAVETFLDGERPPTARRLVQALRAGAQRVGVEVSSSTIAKDGKTVSAYKGLRLVAPKQQTESNVTFTKNTTSTLAKEFV